MCSSLWLLKEKTCLDFVWVRWTLKNIGKYEKFNWIIPDKEDIRSDGHHSTNICTTGKKKQFFSPQKNKKQKSAQIYHCTSICFWCVIRIIFGVFSLFCFGLLWNQWRQLPCCADLPLIKENLPQKSLFCLQTLWQHEIQLQPISHLSQLHQQEPLRKKTSSGAHFHIQIHTIRRMYDKAAKILRYAHACHWFFTQAHTHLCLCDGRGAFVLLREEEADGHEQLVNADSELFLILASCSERKEPTGLDDVLKNVLAGLRGKRKKGKKNLSSAAWWKKAQKFLPGKVVR